MLADNRFSIEHIAELARIELTPDSIAQSQQELQRVLDFIAILDELELTDVEPFFGSIESPLMIAASHMRNDEVQPSTPRESILGNAPDQDGEFYHVPPVFE